MKMIYVVQGISKGCNGNIIHWADSAFTDEQEAMKRCDRMNRSMKNDPNFFAYVTGMSLDQYHTIKKLRRS